MKVKSRLNLSLAWEITIVLVVKLILLFLIWYCFFNEAPVIDSSDFATQVFGEVQQGETP